MARERTLLGTALASSAALYAASTLFAATPAPLRQPSPSLRGAASSGAGAGGSYGNELEIGAGAGAVGCALAGLAAAVLGSARAAREPRDRPRLPRVAARALGSIAQFKIFGPEDDRFEIEVDKVLGVGGQGTVYQCHRQSSPDVKYAVKTIPIWRLLMEPRSDEKIADIRKEVDVLEKLTGNENICQCIGCYDAFRPGTTQGQYIMMVMELVDGGELASYIKDGREYLDEPTAKSVARQTAAGLKFIHDQKVVHRDLKAENILVCGKELTPDTKVKLIDFGVAKSVQNTFVRSCVGTTEIMAPELVSAKMMIAPKGRTLTAHGPTTFRLEEGPGFGIVTQRPDGRGAMVDGIEPGGQAERLGVGDGWAITSIDGIDITELPFVKDFNELGAGTMEGVKAIAEILGGLEADFTMTFVELPKREFSEKVDLWSYGVVLYTMLAGKVPFASEEQIVNGEYLEEPIAHCSDDAKSLIKGLLKLDPEERMSLDDVISHPWLA